MNALKIGETAPLCLTHAQRVQWLRLIRTEHVGPVSFRLLLNQFGSAEAALEILPELSRRGGARRRPHSPTVEEIEAEIALLARLQGRFVAIGEEDYPRALRMIDTAPPLLALRGVGKGLTDRPCVAIVGGRNCSLSGQKIATQFSKELVQFGFCIVSGLARGIDTAAHSAACAGGTIAVMAGGVDVIYPPENEDLALKIIAQGGALMSELPLRYQPRPRDFPRRNRLISGVSLGVLLIEAAARSGSLHTARFALEQGREVFAVPGSPLDPRVAGCNTLIRQGATLVTHPSQIQEALSAMQELPFDPPPPLLEESAEGPLSGWEVLTETERGRIVNALGPTPVEVDELCRFLNLPVRCVQIVLLELELAGRLERHTGQKVSLLL